MKNKIGYNKKHGWSYAKDIKEKKFSGTGRNEKCPCGSGIKYKKCCGK